MAGPTGIQILDVGAYAKPASILIEKITDAIGGLAKPWQIKRVARAESDAKLVEAETDRRITELERRALNRLIAEEARKQNNIESITAKALPDLTEEANPEDVEDDWITNFFDKGRLISDDEMQTLWARILAGEANSPGSYSKRTVNILAGLDRADAMLFMKLCGFGFRIGDTLKPLIYDLDHDIYAQQDVTFPMLGHLDDLGLIHFGSLAGYKIEHLPHRVPLYYHGERVCVDLLTPEDNDFKIGYVYLAQAGTELAQICKPEPVEGFADYIRAHWESLGYRIAEPTAESSEEEDASA